MSSDNELVEDNIASNMDFAAELLLERTHIVNLAI